jgi:hypothetical protein
MKVARVTVMAINHGLIPALGTGKLREAAEVNVLFMAFLFGFDA